MLLFLFFQACFSTLGKTKLVGDWKAIRREVRKPGFVKSILEFKSDNMKQKTRDFVTKNFIDTDKWDAKAINRASQACGPLALWCQSQVFLS